MNLNRIAANFKIGFLLWFLSTQAFALDPIEFERINRKDGLPSNSITSILQDPYGMMWFGTQNGLVRFDGYHFKLFAHSASDSNTLSENSIRTLAISKPGNLLIAHDNASFDELNLKTEKITRIKYTNAHADDVNLHVITMHLDKEGQVWLGTNRGISRYDEHKKSFTHYSITALSDHSLTKGFVSSIIDDGKDHFLLYLSGSNVIRFNRLTGEAKFWYSIGDKKETEFLINKGGILYLDERGYLWMGTEFKGLCRIDINSGALRFYDMESNVLKSNVVMDIKKDSWGRLWIATDGGGLLQYDYQTDSFQTYQYDPEDPMSLSSNATYTIFEDKNKNIWLGNYATGLNVIMHNKRKFEMYTNQGEKGHTLSNKSVLSFAPAQKGNIWIGTDGGGLNLFDPTLKTFKAYTKSNSSICSNIAKALLKDHEGNLWIGTYARGLCKAEVTHNDNFVSHSIKAIDSSAIRHLNVWSLAEDKNHHLWVGLLSAGLDCYRPDQNRIVSYPYTMNHQNGLSNGSILALLVDRKNNVWAGTEAGGLCLLDRTKQTFSSFQNIANDKESISSNDITSILEDSDGHIWAGTRQGGLSKLLDIKKKKFRNYGPKDGLECNTVFGVLEDVRRNLWMSTDNGIFRFDRSKNTFRRFTIEDGLQSLEFNYNACFKDSSGYLYFGGPEGFNRFHPDQIVFNRAVPNVYITNIRMFHHDIEANVSYHDKIYYQKPTHLLDTLEIEYTDHTLTLEFACNNFVNRSNNKFSYRLTGFTTQWDTVDASERFATYTNLAPGQYVFQVRASNNDGIWNVKGKKLVIIVHPAWWMTWWFKSLMVASVLLLLTFLYYLRIRQIKEKNTTLSKLVKFRTRELEKVNNSLKERNEEITQMNNQMMAQQNEILLQKDHLEQSNAALNESNATKDKFFSIVAHDLRNPVSALKALTEMLQNNYSQLGETDRSQIVGHIQTSSSSLKYLVDNLLDWALIQSKHVKVAPALVYLHPIVEECFKVLKLHASDKLIILENLCDEQQQVYADPNMLKTVIRNLVSNSIKFSQKNGKVTINCSASNHNKVLISLKDSGIGIPKEKLNQLFSKEKVTSTSGTSNEKGSGIGLLIVKEFVEANSGILDVKSNVGKGTTFSLMFPAHSYEAELSLTRRIYLNEQQ